MQQVNIAGKVVCIINDTFVKSGFSKLDNMEINGIIFFNNLSYLRLCPHIKNLDKIILTLNNSVTSFG